MSDVNEDQKIIIAQSGTTTGFNITDVDMKHYVGPNFHSKNTNLGTLNIKIAEPGAFRLS